MRQQSYKRKHSISGVITILLCTITVIMGCYYLLSDNQEAKATTEINKGYPITVNKKPEPPAEDYTIYKVASDLQINSSNAILICLDNGTILFDKDSTSRSYPASVTKIMTAVVALEKLSDLNENILLSKKMYSDIYSANAVTAGFLPDEQVCVIDLLYGLLLPSGAECAIGLAERVAGSESGFADLMNDKARELGMNDTHFVNATGLHDKEHYTTARDMAELLRYALENDTFYKIFTTSRHSSNATNLHEGGITYYSTLFSSLGSADFVDGMILGGKTGYTTEAGQCLASLAEKDGRKFILVTFGAQGDNRTQKLHIDDALTIFSEII